MIWQWEGVKNWVQGEDFEVTYEFHFGTRLPANSTLNVTFKIMYEDELGNTVTLLDNSDTEYDNTEDWEVETQNRVVSFAVSNVPAGAHFYIEDGPTSTSEVLAMPVDHGPFIGAISVKMIGPFDLSWRVRPYNKADDGDSSYGFTYKVMGASNYVFEVLSEDAPGARYIFSFGDRLIALGDFGNTQRMSWCSDGDLYDWLPPLLGGTGDAGYIDLLDAHIDPIDDLMCGAHIGGANFALYRKRSIWRGFETGNVDQAVGAVPWIPGVGTEFRFSLQIIPGGNIFLANDSMAYILNENGQLTAVGGPIRDEIIAHLTAEDISVDYNLVDSLFDSWRQEYWLAIPEDGAEYVTAIWIFDVGAFNREQKILWRKRPMPNGVRRLAAVTMLPELQQS